jgi:hypothetical protein
MDSSIKKLNQQMQELSRREHRQTDQVRSILNGAVRFIEALSAQQRMVDILFSQLTRLELSGARNDQQKAELTRQRQAMIQLQAVAAAIVSWAKGAGTADLPAQEMERTREEGIKPMLRAEQMRRIRALRIQGPLVGITHVKGEKCNGMRTEALVRIARHLTRATSDPHSGLGSLWRWMSKDGSLWLYHHHDSQKWKCLFFRITVHRLLDDLNFSLESYVPFGFGKDPAQYEMASSNVFIRPRWLTTDVTSMTYNATNTFNVQSTFTRTAGVSIGETLTTNSGESIQDGTADTDSDSSAWSSGWSDSFGMGGGGSNSSSSSNSGSGHSQSRSHSKTTNVGEAFGVQTTLSDSVSEAVSGGFARAVGEALQVGVWAYGIDFGKSPKLHLEQWRHGNPDAAVVFDNVHLLFETICKEVTTHLQAMGSGRGQSQDDELEQRLDEIRAHMLVQDLEQDTQSVDGKSKLLTSGQPPSRRLLDGASGPAKAR